MRIGVIGLGVGRVHLEEYKKIKDVEVVSVCDLDSKVLKEASKKYEIKAYTDVKEMFKKEKLDGVSICTPPKSHPKLTLMAAERGIHVLCEKPMASTLEGCDKMIKVCDDNEVILMIGQKKRFVPALSYIKKHIDSDFGLPMWGIYKYALGKVGRDWFWEEDNGGGPLVENAIHAIDTLRYLMGEVQRVYAEGDNLFSIDRAPQIDCGVYTLRFENGGIATIGAGYASEWEFATENLSLTTKKVVIDVYGPFDFPNEIQYIYRDKPTEKKERFFEDSSPFLLEIQHFLECIESGSKPITSGEEGRKSLKVCLAVKKSIKLDRSININQW